MVAEALYRIFRLERKRYAFLSGFLYAIAGILFAWLIFPSSTGIMSVAFASILSIPPLTQLLRQGTNRQAKPFSLRNILTAHRDIFQVYFFIFLGVFAAYGATAFILPHSSIPALFETQLNAATAGVSDASKSIPLSIILRNTLILGVAFLLSFMHGGGAVLFLVWIASVWGVAFSFFVQQAAFLSGEILLITLGREVVLYLPHMVTEAAAYIGAAIVGGIVSKAVLREEPFSARFNRVLIHASIFLVLALLAIIIAAVIEVMIFL